MAEQRKWQTEAGRWAPGGCCPSDRNRRSDNGRLVWVPLRPLQTLQQRAGWRGGGCPSGRSKWSDNKQVGADARQVAAGGPATAGWCGCPSERSELSDNERAGAGAGAHQAADGGPVTSRLVWVPVRPQRTVRQRAGWNRSCFC